MAEIELKTIETVSNQPFRKLVTTIGELPSAFIESMSYYEMLAWLVNWLENTVIPAVNNNAEAVKELQRLFVELKNFVDNYFENLDVQEEINNKLDEMAESGELEALIINYFKQQEVSYEMFGAKGDGVTDDYAAIKATHDYANEHHLKVVGLPEKTYLIKDVAETIDIETNVDWKNSTIIFDDTDEGLNNIRIFRVKGNESSSVINQINSTLSPSSTNCGVTGHGLCIMKIENSTHKDFIRTGGSADSGENRTEYILIDNEGTILTPLHFEFNAITSATIKPIESSNLTIKNGNFVTRVNSINSEHYINRNIYINRSNTIVENIKHTLSAEGIESSSPYVGFIFTAFAYNIEIKDSFFTANSKYGASASYEINNEGCIDLKFTNIKQLNSFTDANLWTVQASNYCRNIVAKDCIMNIIDAHKGVYNLTIENCKLRTITVVGYGDLTIKDTEGYLYYFIYLREDYGSFWDGKVIIRNCKLITNVAARKRVFYGGNTQNHNYGYECKLPDVDIDGLEFINGEFTTTEANLFVMNAPSATPDFTKTYDQNAAEGVYPYIYPSSIVLKNIKMSDDGKFIPVDYYTDFNNCYFEEPGTATITGNPYTQSLPQIYNYHMLIDNCDISRELDVSNASNYHNYNNSIFGNKAAQGVDIVNNHRGVGHIEINNCEYLQLGNSGRAATYFVKNSSIYLTASGYTRNYGRFIIDNCILHCRYNGNTSNICFGMNTYAYTISNSKYVIDDSNIATIGDTEAIFKPWSVSGNHATVIYRSINNDFGLTETEFNSLPRYSSNKGYYLWSIFDYINTPEYKIINRKVSDSTHRPDYDIKVGTSYFDTTSNTILSYDGTNWV